MHGPVTVSDANDSISTTESVGLGSCLEQSHLHYTHACPLHGRTREYNKRDAKEIAEGDEGDESAGLPVHCPPCEPTALAILHVFAGLTGDVTMSQIQSAGSLTAVSPETASRATSSKRAQVPRGMYQPRLVNWAQEKLSTELFAIARCTSSSRPLSN